MAKTDSQKVTAIAKVLKKRFPNLPFEEVLDMAQEIFDLTKDEHS